MLGLELAKQDVHRRELRQVVYQALMLEAGKDARFAPRALQELRTAYVENPSDYLKMIIGKFRSRCGLD